MNSSEIKTDLDQFMKKLNFITKEIPSNAATTHFCFLGSTGSGKTISIRLLMQSAVDSIGHGFGHRALIYDAKRDMMPILCGIIDESYILTLNPFDKRSVAWDMAQDITSPANALELASILIPSEENASQPFFTDASRDLLKAVIISFILTAKDEETGKPNWTFRDLVLTMLNQDTLIEVLNRTNETKGLVKSYFSHEGTAQNIMSTIASKMNAYGIIAALWHQAYKKKRKISLNSWLKKEFVLVLGNDHTNRVAIDAINRVIFKRLSELILAEEDINEHADATRRTWIFLDEFVRAGKLDGIVELATEGRSKGVAIVLGFQDINGLRSVYGKEVAEEIVGQCSNIAILRLQSPETAEWASKLFGQREIEEVEFSDSSGTSKQSASFISALAGRGGDSSGQSQQTSKTTKKLVKDTVLNSAFINLPVTNAKNGLHGFRFSPYFETAAKLHIAQILPEVLFGEKGQLKPKKKKADGKTDIEGVIPRDDNEQFLEKWNLDDLKRLRLNDYLIKEIAKANVSRVLTTEEQKEINAFSKVELKLFEKECRKIEIQKRKDKETEKKELIQEIIEVWSFRNLTDLEREEFHSLSEEEKKKIMEQVSKKKKGDIPFVMASQNKKDLDEISGKQPSGTEVSR